MSKQLKSVTSCKSKITFTVFTPLFKIYSLVKLLPTWGCWLLSVMAEMTQSGLLWPDSMTQCEVRGVWCRRTPAHIIQRLESGCIWSRRMGRRLEGAASSTGLAPAPQPLWMVEASAGPCVRPGTPPPYPCYHQPPPSTSPPGTSLRWGQNLTLHLVRFVRLLWGSKIIDSIPIRRLTLFVLQSFARQIL